MTAVCLVRPRLTVTPAVAAAWSSGTASSAGLVMRSVPSRIAVIAADRIIIDSDGDRAGRLAVEVGASRVNAPGLCWCRRSMLSNPSTSCCPSVAVRGGGVAERLGVDGNEPAGELPAADVVEQAGAGGVDARVDERRGDVLGQVLEVVAGVGAGPGVVVQVVDLVDQDQLGSAGRPAGGRPAG